MLTVSGMCMCHRCEARTKDTYRMVGHCSNCHADPILMTFRAGDDAHNLTCPVCGCWRKVRPDRLAMADDLAALAMADPTRKDTP